MTIMVSFGGIGGIPFYSLFILSGKSQTILQHINSLLTIGVSNE